MFLSGFELCVYIYIHTYGHTDILCLPGGFAEVDVRTRDGIVALSGLSCEAGIPCGISGRIPCGISGQAGGRKHVCKRAGAPLNEEHTCAY